MASRIGPEHALQRQGDRAERISAKPTWAAHVNSSPRIRQDFGPLNVVHAGRGKAASMRHRATNRPKNTTFPPWRRKKVLAGPRTVECAFVLCA